jgi:drug/metabolite transporter (DMT)-like permease
MVVFTPVFQLIIERRPPRAGNMVGVLIVTSGLYFLTSPAGSAFNVGDALNLFCALLFAIYIVYLDIFGKQQSPEHLTFMQFVSTFLLGLVGALTLETPRFHLTASSTGIMAYLILFPTIIALYIQAKYQKDTTPTRSAVIFSTEPVLAAAFAYAILNERLAGLGLVGAGLILAGVLVSEFSDDLFRSLAGKGADDGA